MSKIQEITPEISGEIKHYKDAPDDPYVVLEAGCNELWLNASEARAVIDYLQSILPELGGGDPELPEQGATEFRDVEATK